MSERLIEPEPASPASLPPLRSAWRLSATSLRNVSAPRILFGSESIAFSMADACDISSDSATCTGAARTMSPIRAPSAAISALMIGSNSSARPPRMVPMSVASSATVLRMRRLT